MAANANASDGRAASISPQNPLATPNEVAAIHLYTELGPLQRLDGWPFALVDAFALGLAINWNFGIEMVALCVAVAISIHALAALSSHWSLRAKRFLRYSAVDKLEKARFVYVQPQPHQGKPAIVPLTEQSGKRDGESARRVQFAFRNLTYTVVQSSDKKLHAHPRAYPIDEPLARYHASEGLTDGDAASSTRVWGPNEFDIPLPTFKELFIDQLLAPMFVFQLFCMLLFFLDEYWWLSLFTLAMLLIIEGTVVKQRLFNVRELRQMGAVDDKVNVFRKRQWHKKSPKDLVPGDLCAIPRGAVPADLLLLSGSCIVNEAMLTGEAIPQMKEPLPTGSGNDTLRSLPSAKLHIIHRGTEVVQVSPPPKTFGGIRCTAESAAVGYVVRTGFATEQGNLLRTIIGNSERVSANNMEMAIFILFLLAFAIAASCHVFFARVETTTKVHKLVVECLLIITAVVPPELPVQLSLAVNNALLKLREKAITCTEPFRIPFAGKLDVCCFDKTGTLTEGSFVVDGVSGLSNSSTELVPLSKLSELHPVEARVLAGCHALAHVDNELVGDPLEMITLSSMGWHYSRAEVATPQGIPNVKRQAVKVLKRFHFSSALKRMSTLASASLDGIGDRVVALCKGAPETLKGRFVHNVPDDYDANFEYHARRGARVLALGYRVVEGIVASKAAVELTRDDVENDLTFAGFLVVSSPIKADSADVVEKLKKASHHVAMITGDNPLTACHVAREVGIADRTKKILTLIPDPKGSNGCVWTDDSGVVVANFSPQLKDRAQTHELCVTGSALKRLVVADSLSVVLPFTSVYARTTPDQKTSLVSAFNAAGLQTLMCGDGTNDVGALRRAHVGIALTPGQVRTKAKKVKKKRGDFDDPLANLQDYTPPKLGDAVMASSFTSRNPSVMVVCNVIRQGRCTLVTSTQMLRILALNCLMNSYGMSVLYLRGVKFGDTQLTFNAFFVASSMFAVTRSDPLKHLAPQRPADSVLAPNVLLSILAQFALHVTILSYMVDAACTLQPPEPFDPEADPESEEGKFKVSLLNTTVYLITWGFTIATIFVNYNGFPFMHTFWQNVALKRSVTLFGAVALFAASGVSPGFCEFLELVPDIPLEFRVKLVGCMVFDVAAAWVVDAAVQAAFPLSSTCKMDALKKRAA